MIEVEGLNLKNEPLSNFQLIEAAKKLKLTNFRGVFTRDQLPKKPNINECGILNIDSSDGGGTHWICWYKNKNKKICFDSYGLAPPIELKNYLKSPVFYNSDQIQEGPTVYCGHLCLYVLKKLNNGKKFQSIINTLI